MTQPGSLESQFDALQKTNAALSKFDDIVYIDSGDESDDDCATTVIYDRQPSPSMKLKELTDLQAVVQQPTLNQPASYEGQPIKTYSVEFDNHPIAQCATEAYATNGIFELSYKDIWHVFRSVLPVEDRFTVEKIEQHSDHVTRINRYLSIIGSPEVFRELHDIIYRMVVLPDKLTVRHMAEGYTYTICFYCHSILIPLIKELQCIIEHDIRGTEYPNPTYKMAAIFYDDSPIAHCTSGWVFDLAPRRPLSKIGYTDGNRLLIHSGIINDANRTKPYNYTASFSASKAVYYYMSRSTIYRSGNIYRLMD